MERLGNPLKPIPVPFGDRDLAVLQDIESYRLLTTRHIQRLHFTAGHHTTAAGTRACTRVLARLRAHRLIDCLQRRVGGVRRGSSGFVWHLAAAGDRLQRSLRGEPARRRFTEPSAQFVAHTLAVAELAVQFRETDADRALQLLDLEPEPASWRPFLSGQGTSVWLKSDLFARYIRGDYEHHSFIEADRASEHLPVIVRQCLAYQTYAASGRHQAVHGLFPTVLWVAPNPIRATAIHTAITENRALDDALFHVITADQFVAHLTAADDDAN